MAEGGKAADGVSRVEQVLPRAGRRGIVEPVAGGPSVVERHQRGRAFPGPLTVTRDGLLQFGVDSAMWALAIAFAVVAWSNLQLDGLHRGSAVTAVGAVVLVQFVSGIATGLYVGRWRCASFDEVAALAASVGLSTATLLVLNGLAEKPIGPTSIIGTAFIFFVLAGGARSARRLQVELAERPTGAGSTRLLVFGAGEGGVQAVVAMLSDRSSPFYPVGMLDDDPSRRSLRVMGVPVVGTRADLERAADRLHADGVLIAMPSAASDLIAEVSDLAGRAGLLVKVLPPLRELLDHGVGVSDIRDIEVSDVLGRHPVRTDVAAAAGYLTGKRVLVTGAGGSIGSELCRQIAGYGPAELIMLDRDESGLHAVQLSIEGRALLDTDNIVLCDIRDVELLTRLFEERRPEVVFHAAALKHLPLLERAPGEAIKTNVWGTLAVLEAAAATQVERFVNISTDKAADPVSVLGYSKRIAERLTTHVARQNDGLFMSVRFGNVLGSSGSVLTTFQAQLNAGRPLTVTDPDVSRYFMTIEEAVELVIQAGMIGRPGESLVLDMGSPVRIAEVAEWVCAQAGDEATIVYTWLLACEKLHEVLFGAGVVDARPFHPAISHVAVPALNPLLARSLDAWDSNPRMIVALRRLCATPQEAARDQADQLYP